MFFYVYVLESQNDGNRYIGFTNNLTRRIEEHRKGLSPSTKPRLPMKLIYFEACTNEDDARRRERYLKVTGGRRFLAKRLIAYYQSEL
ncbi:MAG: GIY-YIG nuclease family protein [Patescibacteria group bacterium]